MSLFCTTMGIKLSVMLEAYPPQSIHPQPSPYRTRKPQATALYQCVDHFETLEQVYDERFVRQYGFFRPYVRNVIYRFVDGGILHS